MPVTGTQKVVAAIRRIPAAVREEVEAAIVQAADLVLRDMQSLAPKDTGALAAALTKAIGESGLSARIGLPTDVLASDFYYARFLEFGTKGGEVSYRRRGSPKSYVMRVPARAPRPFMGPALDLNREQIEALIRDAVTRGMERAKTGG